MNKLTMAEPRFGDFTLGSSNSQFTPDDEWGDFLDSGSNNQTGAAFSLFGEPEDDQKPSPAAEDNSNAKIRDQGSNGNFTDSLISNPDAKFNKLQSGGSPCVSRVQSLNYLASFNGEPLHISTSLFPDSNCSIFTLSNRDFDMFKSNHNGLSTTLSVDQIKTGLVFESNPSSSSAKFTSSSFGTWNPDFHGLTRTKSADAVTSLNDQESLQVKTKSAGLVSDSNASSSPANFASSSSGLWNSDFDMSKSYQNGLSTTLSLDVPSSLNGQAQNVASLWNVDINRSNSNQTGLNRTFSLDGLTNLSDSQGQQIKTESGGPVPDSNGSSSPLNGSSSTFGGWNFDFGGFGSAIDQSNSTVSSGVSGLNSCLNAVRSNENLNAAQSNNDDEDNDDDDGWEFKDAYSMSTVGDGSNKATPEAREGHETNAFSFDFHNGLNGSADLFATSNQSATADSKAHHAGDIHAYSSGFSNNNSIDLFATSNEPVDLFATSSDGRGEQKDSNGALDPYPFIGSGESDDDFGEFTTAFSDSELKLEEEWKVNDVAHSGLQASESDDKDQVKESKLENHKGALPLSIFGDDDEELEIGCSSNIEDLFGPHNASYPKNDRSPDSNISINDLISNLYSQAEQISPVHSVQVRNSIRDSQLDSVSNSNLVNGEDDPDDGEWEFKDGSFQMRTDNDSSPLTFEDQAQRSFSSLNQDHYLDLYSKLRNELCYHAKRHLDDLKNARSIDALPVEEAKISTLIEEIEEACKDIEMDSVMCKGDQLEGHSSRNACMSALIEILQEPKFQVLESEYHLSRRLSLVDNDLEATVDLIRHATMMLKILKSGSLEEQSIYVSVWNKIISVCAQELQNGSCIWKKILEMNGQSHMFSHPKGRAFIRALGEIYRVAVVLEASVKLCKPWTWLNSSQFTSIHSLLDECRTMWSSLGLGEALSSMLDFASSEDGSSAASLLDSIKLIHGLDALTLQKHLFSQKEVCRVSLLTLEVLPGMKLIDWNGEHYFLTLANLWANLISSDPPELPHLIF